jgi:hypothetical protein
MGRGDKVVMGRLEFCWRKFIFRTASGRVSRICSSRASGAPIPPKMSFSYERGPWSRARVAAPAFEATEK